jgi:hypothetical protein
MSKAFSSDGQSAQSRPRPAWPLAIYDDDDDEVDDDTDFDEEDEPSIHRGNQWFARPGFGSPEWWSGTA